MLWEICQALQDPEAALAHLRAAIAEDPLFTRLRTSCQPAARSVLLLAAPGDFQANLPLDRLFDESTDLHTLWLADPQGILRDPARFIPANLPWIDCTFIAIAEDAAHRVVLRAADALAAVIGAPVINSGAAIGQLSRAGTAAMLQDLPDAIVPSHHLVAHGTDLAVAFPVIIRPFGSHAGKGLQRLADEAALANHYAENASTPWFTVAHFVDYRSLDKAWRKYRVIFVAGVAYPLHLAIHDDWAIWYYNAGMHLCANKQSEEAGFLADIQASLPQRTQAALRELALIVGLDYFGLDCGVMPDGRLLVFEIETGMIVHDRTSESAARPPGDPSVPIRKALERLIDRRSLDAG